MIERWFAELTNKAIRRGSWAGLGCELVTAIHSFLGASNQDPTVYVWTASAESIREKVARCQAILRRNTRGGPSLVTWVLLLGPAWIAIVSAMTASQRRGYLLRHVGRSPHLAALLVAVGGFFLLIAVLYDGKTSATGDEPHYLVISETLLRYHSLEVANTYRNRDYLSFYNGTLDLSHTVTNYQGVQVSVHGVGGPILWLPLFAVAGRMGAILFMAGVSLLVIADIFRFLEERGIRKRVSVLVAGSFAAATPFFAFAHLVFVDLIGAWAVIYLFRKILKDGELRKRELVSSSILVGILPWVHVKFIAVEALLLVFLLAKIVVGNKVVPAGALVRAAKARWKEVCWAVVPAAVLGLGYEAFSHAIWNSLNPALFYSQVDRAIPFTASPIRGLIGTFLDQEYGVFMSAPVLVLAIPGFVLAVQGRVSVLNLYFPILAVCYIALFAARYDWEGGWTPPGRFILVLLPIFAYYIGHLLDRPNRLLARPAFWILGAVGTVYNLVSLRSAHQGFSTGVGRNETIAYIQDVLLHRSPTQYLPSTVNEIDYMNVMVWAVIICTVCWLVLLKVPAEGRNMPLLAR